MTYLVFRSPECNMKHIQYLTSQIIIMNEQFVMLNDALLAKNNQPLIYANQLKMRNEHNTITSIYV